MGVCIPVVGAALVRDGRVLAARRMQPAALAGGWEFPGGKVEPGESDVGALVARMPRGARRRPSASARDSARR